ncbi:MAG: hypothetical protein M1823_002844 [Watsoniomyces obsoletus]|nr:MAG: hypothetical protein M1823_002844 [Watsoniomyces obsoletus]
MSYLQKQVDAFKVDLTSSSTKISNKRNVSTAVSVTPNAAPSPAPSTSSQSNDLKRKRPVESSSNVVYSQPADTGTGRHIMTQVTYAVEYLKNKEAPQSLSQVVGYLSLKSPESQQNMAMILKKHDRVEFQRDGNNNRWDGGSYRFRPLHNIRSAQDLLAYLQTRPTAQGVSVRELKDGWSGADAAIDMLEAKHQILVTRNKKDNHARMVWANDATLAQHVDPLFQSLWFKATLPSKEDLPGELEKLGLKPTSSDPSSRVSMAPKQNKKKQKKPRTGGRTTNTHMAGILRDYSSMKK